MRVRENGIIKAYVESRGFGFIRPANGGNELFFHKTKCDIDEQDLKPGLAVEFAIVANWKQPGEFRAIDVTAAEEAN